MASMLGNRDPNSKVSRGPARTCREPIYSERTALTHPGNPGTLLQAPISALLERMPMRTRLAFALALVIWLGFALLPVSASPIAIATLGDSLTDTYAGSLYAPGEQSWTDQLMTNRSDHVQIHNLARFG